MAVSSSGNELSDVVQLAVELSIKSKSLEVSPEVIDIARELGNAMWHVKKLGYPFENKAALYSVLRKAAQYRSAFEPVISHYARADKAYEGVLFSFQEICDREFGSGEEPRIRGMSRD
jgi:hypothetical protein